MRDWKALWMATGAILVLTVAQATDANAQHDRCKNELLTASGSATILGMGRARRLAIDNWQREVRQKYGERYMDFSKARQARHECQSASVGTLGQLNKRCSVSGYPCSSGNVADDADAAQGGDSTFTAQRLLVRLGYLKRDDVDGEYGPITRRAVSKFQRDERLRVTGELDDATMKRLREKAERR